jgi:hypothetical protein
MSDTQSLGSKVIIGCRANVIERLVTFYATAQGLAGQADVFHKCRRQVITAKQNGIKSP